MKSLLRLLSIFVLACIASPLPAAKSGEEAIQRFSFIVGSNYGGPGRATLRYAVSDARAIMRVLTNMGGVNIPDCTLLVEPGREQFTSGLEEIRTRIMQAATSSRRVEFIFYYSGHSDEEGLLLGREKINYREMRKYIEGMPADVRIAILDSCSSGAFTRSKGGKMHAPFMVDTSYSMKGYAFLTSSSADEASQESDKMKGSFFTHFLVTGLRGAADMNEDRRITLNEAYQFAYQETLARTEKTYGGPQHPNYHIQMTGTGDVIITDIRGKSAGLLIGREIYGRLSIRDHNKNLVTELSKPAGRSITLALEDGEYIVLNEKNGKIYEADITLRRSKSTTLLEKQFSEARREYAVARGDADGVRPVEEEYRVKKYSFSWAPLRKGNEKTIHTYSLSLFGSYCTRQSGVDLGLGLGLVDEDASGVQMNYVANYVIGNFTGWQASNFFNYAGEDASGFQLSGGGDYVGGNYTGLQLSSIFNYAGKDVKGLQATAITNIAKGKVYGMQLSAITNYAGDGLSGMQMSLVNIAGETRGMQLGIVNIGGETKGMQMGLVNIAEKMEGLPLGLVNIAGNGNIGIVSWWSSLTEMNAGVRFRVNHFYTMFAAGGRNRERDVAEDKSLATEFFMGLRLMAWKLFLDADAGFTHLDNSPLYGENASNDQMAIQARAMLGIDIIGGLSVFAGGGTTYLWDYGEFSDGGFKPLFIGGAAFEF